jgi:hypothetical protein
MNADNKDNPISDTSAVSPTRSLDFNWTDPNASIANRIIGAIVAIIFLPVGLMIGVMCLVMWTLSWVCPKLFPNLQPNVKGEAPALAGCLHRLVRLYGVSLAFGIFRKRPHSPSIENIIPRIGAGPLPVNAAIPPITNRNPAILTKITLDV